MFAYIPLVSCLVSLGLTYFVLQRWTHRRRPHLLLWGLGALFYGIGGFAEFYYGVFGWNDFIFRIWYLFGAILVAAWLGQGTAYLLLKRKTAHILMGILLIGSLYATVRVFTAPVDPSAMLGGELSGHALPKSVRLITPFFNIYGTLLLVGGAAYSAYIFWRKRVLLHRTIGNVLIAVGAMLPAFGGTFSRAGIPYALYWGELLGIILIFAGFWRATHPIGEPAEND
jgi:hypothetical protein